MRKELRVDFHVHSTASDGTNSPQELIRIGLNKGIEYFSITDHDTVDGVKSLLDSQEIFPNELSFVTGVEISAEFPTTLHLLGYNFDISDKNLNDILKNLQEYRQQRNNQMIQNMKNYGFDITLEELQQEAGKELIGRPHFANLMVQKKYVKDKQEAFDKYLKKGATLYLDKKRLEPEQAIKLIKEAGGIVVLAHPYQTKVYGKDLEKLISDLKAMGLDGIEVYYSSHTKAMVQEYKQLAKKYELIMTAGSDYHGENKVGIELGLNVDIMDIEPFLKVLRKH